MITNAGLVSWSYCRHHRLTCRNSPVRPFGRNVERRGNNQAREGEEKDRVDLHAADKNCACSSCMVDHKMFWIYRYGSQPDKYDFCGISSDTCKRGSITSGCEDPMRRLGSGCRKDLLQGVCPEILAPKSSEDSCQCSYFIHYVERSRFSAGDWRCFD